MLPKEYDFSEVEKRWKEKWDYSMYQFSWDSDKPYFIIDTPPPYPTGNFHIGNALNWFYIDFIARYMRMKGYNVMFPQGWDCHGLPTEVKVEEKYGITKSEIPREEFRELCRKLTTENIEKMRETMFRLGLSIDWSREYITMEPEYYRKTQLSFVRMYNSGYIYREEHPVMYCPRCQTAIAQAEVEYEDRETDLNFLRFSDEIIIATTRPELLSACVAVAVHPEDERYTNVVGKKVRVPLFGHEVEVIADEEVDPSYGTGAVMICTFGDKQDVRWWKRHGLPLRNVIEIDGKMGTLAGEYEGMSIGECKKRIVSDLEKSGYLVKKERTTQNVGLCWRCDTPIEIVAQTQWFVKVKGNEIMDASEKIKWIPEHMKIRLKNWVESMDWDWCISRQRIFATPIPVWYCNECGNVMVAKEEWLPVDPLKDLPPEPCSCGSTNFRGEEDVLDTWMDSSITSLTIAGWPEDLRHYPVHLRPQGHDIIRTWAFYTILRSVALVREIPWHSIVINGMVLGEDGRKMSKSLGNIISPEEVIEKHGSDALRQWAATGGIVGSDVQFSWKEVVAASRFMQKFWSVLRFALPHLSGYEPYEEDMKYLKTSDRWLLSKLTRLVRSVTEHMDNYRFDEALKSIRKFIRETLADNYIELVKGRLYELKDRGARFTLYRALDVLIRMYAPFAPFQSEEMYHSFRGKSVHLQPWPEADENLLNEEWEIRGEIVKQIVSVVRRWKHERGLALNAPMGSITVVSDNAIDTVDIGKALNADVRVVRNIPEIVEVPDHAEPVMSRIGPIFRDRAGKIIEYIRNMGEDEIRRIEKSGYLEIEVDGERHRIERDWIRINKKFISRGREVEIIRVQDISIVIEV